MTSAPTPPNAESSTDPIISPAEPEGRFVTLDILRGFALLGILSANMLIFGYLSPLYEPLSFPGLGAAGRAAEWLTITFAEGSFYPLFSFLFGLGFALQLRKGNAVVPLFRRRLFILLGIGLVHAIFIWLGDILVTYALLGFVLVFFRGRTDRTLLFWIGGGTLYTLVIFFLINLGTGGVEGAFPPEVVAQAERIYTTGSYLEVTGIRLTWLFINLVNLVILSPQILAFFLLGLLAGRRGVLQDAAAHRPLLRRIFWVTLGVGLPIVLLHGVELARGTGSVLVSALDAAVGSPALGFAYLSGLALLLGSQTWQRRLEPLAAVGRTALSNYLGQSLVCTLIFYPYGLGLFGRLGPAWGLVLTVGIFGVQLLVSNLWLARYRFGPAEWVWRALTYRTRPAMRRTPTLEM